MKQKNAVFVFLHTFHTVVFEAISLQVRCIRDVAVGSAWDRYANLLIIHAVASLALAMKNSLSAYIWAAQSRNTKLADLCRAQIVEQALHVLDLLEGAPWPTLVAPPDLKSAREELADLANAWLDQGHVDCDSIDVVKKAVILDRNVRARGERILAQLAAIRPATGASPEPSTDQTLVDVQQIAERFRNLFGADVQIVRL